MSRALFSVGEEVKVVESGMVIDSTQVVSCKWMDNRRFQDADGSETFNYTGFTYHVFGDHKCAKYVLERNLRKLPPKSEYSFNELMSELVRENA